MQRPHSVVPVGKSQLGFLDWFVECGHFAFQSIHEFHETFSTSVMVCENQFSCTGMGNVVCVQREYVSALFLERSAHICEKLEQIIYSLKENLLQCWCLFVCTTVSLASEAISYWATIWLTSGPAIIHLLSAEGSSVTPMAPPSALMTALACSCA